MDLNLELLAIQNPWWQGGGLKFDSVVEQYNHQALKWHPAVLDRIDLKNDNIYFLAGLKGVGKTTLVKLLAKKLLEENKIRPNNLFFYSCHNLDSYEQLNEMIKLFLNYSGPNSGRRYIFIDEITLVKNWRRGIEYLHRAGIFKKATVILTGSSWAEMALNGSFIKFKLMSSLSFNEFASLVNPALFRNLASGHYLKKRKQFDYYLDIYLLSGGFVSAINDFKENGAVRQGVYSNFLNWFLAYAARSGRDTVLTRQIMEKIILNLGQSIGFKTLARNTKAKTHLTAAEYLNLFEAMFVVKTIYQTGGQAASRKAKKIYFQDPFMFWLFYSYAHGSLNYWQFSRERLHEGKIFNALVENVVLSQLIKNEANKITYWRDNIKKQEINFIVEREKKTTPILIRFNQEIKPTDFNIFKNAGFKKGIIINNDRLESQGGFKIMPLTYFLMFYEELI
jgi:uncharacterized protein